MIGKHNSDNDQSDELSYVDLMFDTSVLECYLIRKKRRGVIVTLWTNDKYNGYEGGGVTEESCRSRSPVKKNDLLDERGGC